jgi:hypothetical protein
MQLVRMADGDAPGLALLTANSPQGKPGLHSGVGKHPTERLPGWAIHRDVHPRPGNVQ